MSSLNNVYNLIQICEMDLSHLGVGIGSLGLGLTAGGLTGSTLTDIVNHNEMDKRQLTNNLINYDAKVRAGLAGGAAIAGLGLATHLMHSPNRNESSKVRTRE